MSLLSNLFFFDGGCEVESCLETFLLLRIRIFLSLGMSRFLDGPDFFFGEWAAPIASHVSIRWSSFSAAVSNWLSSASNSGLWRSDLMASQLTSSLKKLVESNTLKNFRLFCWAFAKCDLKWVEISMMKWSDFVVGRQFISLNSCLLLVKTRSRMLPALWVGFLIIWERSCLDWNDAIVEASWLRVSCGCPSFQLMLGRL